jgi:hypothetical protein
VRWHDSAEDAKARNAALPPGAEPEPYQEGLAFRPDDGTPRGRWRVVRESVDGPERWCVWDLRRGLPERPQAVLAWSGLPTPQAGIVVANALACARPFRVVLAALRALRTAARAVRDEARLD